MMKRCSKCKEVKKLTSFYKLSSSKDGRRPDCRDCHIEQKRQFALNNPIRHKCNLMASGILKRTLWGIDRPKNKSYKDNNVKCTIGDNIVEISNYLYNNYYDEIKLLIEQGKTPSVDRIDSKGDYSSENIRIIDLRDNVLLGVNNAIRKTSRKIIAINNNNNKEVIFNSISEASRKLNIKRDTIYYHLDKNTTSKNGYKFISFNNKED